MVDLAVKRVFFVNILLLKAFFAALPAVCLLNNTYVS